MPWLSVSKSPCCVIAITGVHAGQGAAVTYAFSQTYQVFNPSRGLRLVHMVLCCDQ